MLRNYLKIAWRNLGKNKFYTFLNVFGLALGLASCLLITLYVLDELSYDKSFNHADRIYRVNSDIKFGGAEMKLAVAPDPMAFTMLKDYPQVEAAMRIREDGSSLVRRTGTTENLQEALVVYVDSSFFKVFQIPIVAGDSHRVLTQPNTMVISERDAEKYFGKENPIGKTLLLDNNQSYTVTGVMENIPSHSHLGSLNMLLSMSTNRESREDNWGSHNFNTYLLLREGVDAAGFEKNFDTILEKYTGKWTQSVMGATLSELKKSGSYIKYALMPVTDIHLRSDRTAELGNNSNVQYVYIFSLVAVFLLAIACVNFMNLATARSSNRAREVGVRKALGSERSSLVNQFLTEAVMLSFLALALAIILAILALPLFNNLAGKEIAFPYQNGLFWAASVVTGIVVGIMAGSYPAFFLSAFQPLKVLKGAVQLEGKGGYLRNSLVVFQFMISVMLIIGTGVIYKQLNYIQTKKLGFNKEQVLIVKNAYALNRQSQAFKEEVSQLPNVETSTITSFLPTPSTRSDYGFFPEGQLQQDKSVSMQKWDVDYDYVKTLNLEMKAGRAFQKDFLSDSSGILINETAAKILGFADPVGKRIFIMPDEKTRERITFTILGVVKNFHFASLRQNIGALSMVLKPSKGLVVVRLKGGDYTKTIGQIEGLWKTMAPGQPFNYQFMDQDFDSQYRSEQRVGQIFITFAVISIIIGCLGLFGLSAYTAERRTKEIGVRKVLGASVGSIVGLLSKDFIKLVLLAIIFGSPIAWYAMNTWLQDFAYHVEISWWMFVSAGILAIVIALLTISFQSIKAALMNPVKSLRSE
ncbi:ABC transporter permease [Dyadobacter psychrotolerans]|uniref:FtsX-like permease family protein n=1 Tax=Dyadobacter psychrotolerans TaxID=2541721 RepID=A0A4V2Z4Y4_9BACT|nr:ABC transporter permease [Dyadobacter psychrotolerans]TDE18558.1 FtsX-like permease family protein [Dyadobacter psychrotolerans]